MIGPFPAFDASPHRKQWHLPSYGATSKALGFVYILSPWLSGVFAVTNRLLFGDNLDWLPQIESKSVDLIYLDPPFNSKASYNLLYRSPDGEAAQAQHQAFVDSWRWGHPTDIAMAQIMASGSPAAGIISALHNYMSKSDLEAYLVMMTARLIELHRILKPTGSLYLHCDASASHYLKIILDAIFEAGSFRNEIIWKRTASKSLMKRRLPTNHDVILFYAREDNTWNDGAAFTPYDPLNVPQKAGEKYSQQDADGRRYQLTSLINPNSDRPNLTYEFLGVTRVWRWTRERMQAAYDEGLVIQTAPGRVPRFKRFLDQQRGLPLDDVWADISPLNSQSAERLGYQTQKPLALLERIIKLSSRPGDLVLDPFCGCGTAIEAAHVLGRSWIGIDVTPLAIDVVERRLGRKGARRSLNYVVDGIPLDVAGANRLFHESPHDFQMWAITLVDGQPREGGKKGADKGIDGIVFFQDDAKTIGQAILSVKGGANIHAQHVRDLIGAMNNTRAKLGVLITLHPPTRAMEEAAREAESIEAGGKLLPRVQILSISDLLAGRKPRMPVTFDIISAAASARRASQRREPDMPTADDIRLQPSLKLPIAGGRRAAPQADLPLEEPLLTPTSDRGARRRRA